MKNCDIQRINNLNEQIEGMKKKKRVNLETINMLKHKIYMIKNRDVQMRSGLLRHTLSDNFTHKTF